MVTYYRVNSAPWTECGRACFQFLFFRRSLGPIYPVFDLGWAEHAKAVEAPTTITGDYFASMIGAVFVGREDGGHFEKALLCGLTFEVRRGL